MIIASLIDNFELFEQVSSIFFESSIKKSFLSEQEKKDFRYKYLDYYKNNYPEFFLIAKKGNKVLGYVCGSPDSIKDSELFNIVPHYKAFEDYYGELNAHLHINLHSESRGLGIGSNLLREFEKLNRGAVHLLTSPDADNRNFYLKNGYNIEKIKNFQGVTLLLMGKYLTKSGLIDM